MNNFNEFEKEMITSFCVAFVHFALMGINDKYDRNYEKIGNCVCCGDFKKLVAWGYIDIKPRMVDFCNYWNLEVENPIIEEVAFFSIDNVLCDSCLAAYQICPEDDIKRKIADRVRDFCEKNRYFR